MSDSNRGKATGGEVNPTQASGRRVRPHPEREHPFRLASQVLDRGAATRPSEEESFVESGVKSAYTVIENYLADGADIARRLGSVSYAPLNDGPAADWRARFTEISAEMLANWFDLMGVASDAILSFGEAASGTAAEASEAAGQRVAVQVSDPQRACAVELRVSGGHSGLRVLELRHGESAHTLSVELSATDSGTWLARVEVGKEHPLGRYFGVVLDAGGANPVGTIVCELVS